MVNGLIMENDTIYDICVRHEGLKERLKEISPVFGRLANPALFNTAARTTTVRKAARTGKIYLNEMLYRLNSFIGRGQEYLAFVKETGFREQGAFLAGLGEDESEKPAWYDKVPGFEIYDVREWNEDPFNRIVKTAESTAQGHGFAMVQSFKPLPLITFLESRGLESYTEKVAGDVYRVYFYRKGGIG